MSAAENTLSPFHTGKTCSQLHTCQVHTSNLYGWGTDCNNLALLEPACPPASCLLKNGSQGGSKGCSPIIRSFSLWKYFVPCKDSSKTKTLRLQRFIGKHLWAVCTNPCDLQAQELLWEQGRWVWPPAQLLAKALLHRHGAQSPQSLKTYKGSAGPLYKDYFHPQKCKKGKTGIQGVPYSFCTCRVQDCSVWLNICTYRVVPLSTCRARGLLEAEGVPRCAATHSLPFWSCATVSVWAGQ